MYKLIRLIRRRLATILVVLMCINSFAAVVGDNDGAAFITKAEFESLKNDFQTQINRYNTSLNSKIDGAIATYLDGIRVKKTKILTVPVSNYQNMKWIRDKLYLYGRYKHFTSKSTYTGPSTNEWYLPYITEKRMNFRGNDFYIFDFNQTAFSCVWVYFIGSSTATSGGIGFNGKRLHEASPNGCPVLAFRLVKANDGNYYVSAGQPLTNIAVCAPYFVVNKNFGGHYIKTASKYLYEVPWYGFNVTDVQILSPDADGYFKYQFTGDTYPNDGFASTIRKSETDWLGLWSGANGTPAGAESYFNALTSLNNESVTFGSDYWSRGGATWNFADPTYYTYLSPMIGQTMMLGRDSDYQVNGYKYTDQSDGERDICNWADSTSEATATINFKKYTMFANGVNKDNWPGTQTISKTGTLKFAQLPTYYLRDLTTGYFKYNNNLNSVKYGQGLPLVIDSTDTGYVQLTFKANTKKIYKDTSNDKNCIFDIKNGDFLTSTSEYVYGYKGDVDPDTTTDSAIQLKDIHINDTSGEYKYTIPINKGDSLWIRLAPYSSTDHAIYAQFDSIKMNIVTEGQ